MKLFPRILYIGIAITVFGCGASKKIIAPNIQLDEMMAQKAFEIKVQSAEPQVTRAMSQIANSGMLPPGSTINRIDVGGSGYYIKVAGDSVSAELPYYGERQMSGGYNSDSGIKFNGLAENLEISKDDSKQRYTVKFRIDGNAENYSVTISVLNNLSSTTTVSSSHRNGIAYSGKVIKTSKDPNTLEK